MDIEQAIIEKMTLERRIQELIQDFCGRTGLCVDEVALRMIDVTRAQDGTPQNMLYRVQCSVSL